MRENEKYYDKFKVIFHQLVQTVQSTLTYNLILVTEYVNRRFDHSIAILRFCIFFKSKIGHRQ